MKTLFFFLIGFAFHRRPRAQFDLVQRLRNVGGL
jgi:hypothetical protein